MREGELLKDVVAALEHAGQRLCILHGYRDYPEDIRSDIDVVSDHATRIPQALSDRKVAKVVQAIHTQPTAAYWYVLHRWDDFKPIFIHLHVFYKDYRINGRVFFRGEEFLLNRRPFKFFMVPDPDLEFAAYLVKKIASGSLNEVQGERLSELYGEDSAGSKRHLARLFPRAEAEHIAEAARSRNWETVRHQIEHLRREMMSKVDREQRLNVLLNTLDDYLKRAERALQLSGLMVAFLGVDGAGKSTVMTAVEQDLAPAFWSTKRYHGRALESPLRWTKRVRMQRQLRRREVEDAATNPHAMPVIRDPHAKPSRGLALSMIKLGLWWADYTFLGYLKEIHPRLRRSGLVLLDRYYHDLLVDPRRHRYGGPLSLARFVGRFYPRPHLVFLLDAPPEVLNSRKKEVSFKETARQREAYLKLVQELPNGQVVDASRPVHEVAAGIEKIILDYMAERTKRRLKR